MWAAYLIYLFVYLFIIYVTNKTKLPGWGSLHYVQSVSILFGAGCTAGLQLVLLKHGWNRRYDRGCKLCGFSSCQLIDLAFWFPFLTCGGKDFDHFPQIKRKPFGRQLTRMKADASVDICRCYSLNSGSLPQLVHSDRGAEEEEIWQQHTAQIMMLVAYIQGPFVIQWLDPIDQEMGSFFTSNTG